MLLNLPGRFTCIFFHGDFIIDIIFYRGAMAKNYQLALKVEERNKAAREAEEDGDFNKAVDSMSKISGRTTQKKLPSKD